MKVLENASQNYAAAVSQISIALNARKLPEEG